MSHEIEEIKLRRFLEREREREREKQITKTEPEMEDVVVMFIFFVGLEHSAFGGLFNDDTIYFRNYSVSFSSLLYLICEFVISYFFSMVLTPFIFKRRSLRQLTTKLSKTFLSFP